MPRKKKDPVVEDKSLLDPLTWVKELIMLTQKLTDAVTRLGAAVAAVDAKIDALIASTSQLATPAEQDAVADQVAAYTATLEAAAQKQ